MNHNDAFHTLRMRSGRHTMNLTNKATIRIKSYHYKLVITNSQRGQFPVGLIAQLVEHCSGIAEAVGTNLVQA